MLKFTTDNEYYAHTLRMKWLLRLYATPTQLQTMPQNTERKCERCNKLKNDLELCSDDLLCRACEVQNAVELTKIKLRRDTQNDATVDNATLNSCHAVAVESCLTTTDVLCISAHFHIMSFYTWSYCYYT